MYVIVPTRTCTYYLSIILLNFIFSLFSILCFKLSKKYRLPTYTYTYTYTVRYGTVHIPICVHYYRTTSIAWKFSSHYHSSSHQSITVVIVRIARLRYRYRRYVPPSIRRGGGGGGGVVVVGPPTNRNRNHKLRGGWGILTATSSRIDKNYLRHNTIGRKRKTSIFDRALALREFMYFAKIHCLYCTYVTTNDSKTNQSFRLAIICRVFFFFLVSAKSLREKSERDKLTIRTDGLVFRRTYRRIRGVIRTRILLATLPLRCLSRYDLMQFSPRPTWPIHP